MKPSVDLWAGNRLQASDSKLPRKIRPNWDLAGKPQTSQAAKMSKVALDDDLDDNDHDEGGESGYNYK